MAFRKFIHNLGKHFEKGSKLERLEPLYEMTASFFYQSSETSSGRTHLRDPLDLKRVMITVVIALIPAILMMFYNTGLQANIAIAKLQAVGAEIPYTYREHLLMAMGLPFDPNSVRINMLLGSLYFMPVYLTVIVVGGFWELLFAVVRKHHINESFLVTSLLFPMILPPTVPLWQAALAISFGIVFGKELFGGTGRNIVNPALLSRAFLFFAYPISMTGDSIWYPISSPTVDAITGATPLTSAKIHGVVNVDWWNAFVGIIPGSMGETSALACLIGAAVLVITGIGSLRIMVSAVVGLVSVVLLFNLFGSDANPYLHIAPHWHLVLGGFAFGAVFMTTDPVSGAMTSGGKIVYGLMMGGLTALVRLVNPAYPEGVMLSILFCNITAPIIDYYFIKRNIKRREVRCAN